MSKLDEKIRNIAVVIIKHNDRILVSPNYDEEKDWHFFRLLGGGIEFRESAQEALEREIKEELGREIVNISLLEVSENIFQYQKRLGHEICFIFKADFKDKADYNIEEFQILDQPKRKAIWVKLNEENRKNITPIIKSNY
ncbi:MAG: NUDIX domain-containing protein [Patescibacteria group bacterium]|nr:NUDIX domain-containing protein [Patescibacteria group bacterium]